MTERMERRSAERASLWNTKMTLMSGRLSRSYVLSAQLKERRKDEVDEERCQGGQGTAGKLREYGSESKCLVLRSFI